MTLGLGIAAAASLLLSAALTGWVRRVALRHGIVDQPNARSSHVRPTPRGGGVAIAATSISGVAFASVLGWMDWQLATALGAGGLLIAAIGFLDDRRSVSVGARLLVHASSAALAVYLVGGLPPLQVGARMVDLGIAGDLLAVVAIVWVTNLFNFMDGIDGIAASEAVTIAGLGALVAAHVLLAPDVVVPSLLFVAACCGFLAWNWPPARIFMGDAGSGFLGFFVAVVALGATRHAPAAAFVWLILGGVFFVDATVTIVRRLLRGARVHEAHREHAYQKLARLWGSHRAVDWVLLAINLTFLAPCAWYAAAHPEHAALVSFLALVALVPLVLLAGAGRAE